MPTPYPAFSRIQPWREWSLPFTVAQCKFLSPPACRAGAEGEEMSTTVFYRRQKWGIAICGLVNAALSVSIAAAAEIKSFDLEDDRVEISISGTITPGDID